MTFSIEKRPDDILLKGELDIASEGELMQALQQEIAAQEILTLDLSELTFIDSSGVRVLIRTAAGLGDPGRLVLKSPRPAVARVFDLMRLDTVPNIEISEE